MLNKKGSVTLQELKTVLHSSESTIRRDLNELAAQGKLQKVFGGAVALDGSAPKDVDISRREEENTQEKQWIARYAASLIQDDALVYLDAGSTTGCMLDFLQNTRATIVTNAPLHAQRLARMNREVILIGGRIKQSTEAAVGAGACDQIRRYNFSIGFFGTNGVSVKAGLSTPDPDEATVKRCAMERTQNSYVVCDHTKFHKISPVTFGELEDVIVLTDSITSDIFADMPNIIDVTKE